MGFLQKRISQGQVRKGSAPFTSAEHVNLSSSRDSHQKSQGNSSDRNGKRSGGSLELATRKNFKELI